jgi:hypothetical protein
MEPQGVAAARRRQAREIQQKTPGTCRAHHPAHALDHGQAQDQAIRFAKKVPDVVPVLDGGAGPAAMGEPVGVPRLAAAVAGYSNLIFNRRGGSPSVPAERGRLWQTDCALLCPAAGGLHKDAAIRPDVPDGQAVMRTALQTGKGIDEIFGRTGEAQRQRDLGLQVRDGLLDGQARAVITGARQRGAQRAFERAELRRDKAFERRVLTRHLPPDGPSVVHGADVGSEGIFSRGGTAVLMNLMCEVELV